MGWLSTLDSDREMLREHEDGKPPLKNDLSDRDAIFIRILFDLVVLNVWGISSRTPSLCTVGQLECRLISETFYMQVDTLSPSTFMYGSFITQTDNGSSNIIL